MTRQLDATAFTALTKLLDKVTDKQETHQDGAALQQIKAFCRYSDENITWISGVLLHRLKDDHAQTRLHVVNIMDQLFQRSRAFRSLLTANFTEFLELSLGFRHDRPLPGPVGIANQLRDRGLEVVEQWNDKYGSTYKQVSLGYNYLKNNMSMRFPEVRARAAAAQAEAHERQVRSQALLQDKYQHICAGFEGHVAEMTATLTQIAEGFTLIEGTTQIAAAAAPAQALAPDDTVLPEAEIAWETVDSVLPAPEASTSAAPESNAGEEGLSEYAMDTIPEDLLQQAETDQGMGSEGTNRAWVSLNNPDPVVVENLQGLAKVVANRHIPRVQGWLKVLVKVEVGPIGSEQQSQRERMLRSAVQLQTQLKQSQQKLEALTQQLASTLSEAQDADMSADSATLPPCSISAAAQAKQGGAVAAQQTSALMESLFGSDGDEDEGTGADATINHTQGKTPTGSQQGGSSAGAVQQHRQTPAATAQARDITDAAGSRLDAKQGSLPGAAAVGQGDASKRTLGSTGPGPSSGQKMLDPAAPRRSISFSNSLRRRQAVAVQQRRDAFNEAADAALIQTLAQRSAAGNQAAASASEQRLEEVAAKPEADESGHVTLGGTPHKLMHNGPTGSDRPASHAPVTQETDRPSIASVPVQASNAVMPLALPQQPSGTQDLPGGRVFPAAAPASASSPPALAEGSTAKEPPEAPRGSTRTSQPEPAPKLKTGSRLAASMAKLAASKRAPNEEPPPEAAAAQVKQSGGVEKKSALSEDVKRALLAKAPVVAHGHDLVYWDSNNARALVNARGMEYQNHWGAHDPEVELPSEQLNAFFGTRAEYWTPSGKPEAIQGHPQQPPGHPQQPAPGLSKQAAGSVASPGRSDRQVTAPSASQGRSAVGNVRAQRAVDRAHNEAAIASTDEQVAQALADAQAAVRTSATRGSKRKPQPTVRERLAKKLLTGRARGQTLGEIESAADEKFQEVNSNRWQATRFP